MLSLLKPHNSTSYDDVIRDLIEDVCPYLPSALLDLKVLEQKNPREAAGERLLLQQEIFEDIVVSRMLRRRESEEESQLDKHLDSMHSGEDQQFKKRLEQIRHLRREKILHEHENSKQDTR